MLTEKDKTRRRPEAAGFVDHRKLPKGAFGRALCRYCGDEVPYPRRSFCSDECVREWKIRTSPSYAAELVLERDAGVCRLCGRDCLALLKELRQLRSACRQKRHGEAGRWLPNGWQGDDRLEEFVARCNELGLPAHLRVLDRRLWEMDHATPVVEGGGSCGLENLRTLCWACHRAATAELRARMRAKVGKKVRRA